MTDKTYTFDFLGPEPRWLTCACGELSSRPECWDCSKKAERARERIASDRESEASIPKRYAWANIKSSLLAERVQATRLPLAEIVRRVLASDRVLLAGGSGSGKTSLAVACLRERLAGGMFVSAPRLGVARIQHHAGDGECALVLGCIAAPLLVLDDLGTEANTATNAVRDVIWARHDAERPTWITTGMRSDDLVARYGDGARRRLMEDAYIERLGPA